MKEGFAICAGQVVAGLMLEAIIGPVSWSAFAWPVNMIILAVLIVFILLISASSHACYICRFLGTYQAAIPALMVAVVLTMLMGLTRQKANGQWLNAMLTFWPFVLTYVYMVVILGVVSMRRLKKLRHGLRRNDITFLLNHMGLFVALVAGTLGNPDMQRVKMVAAIGQTEWRGIDEQHNTVELPVAIELNRFIMEEYDDGTPKRFASDIKVFTQSGKSLTGIVDVNKPISVDGWRIYQYGYDTVMGRESQISIFELVKDPWLPWVYGGIFMMLAGALCLFFEKSTPHARTIPQNL